MIRIPQYQIPGLEALVEKQAKTGKEINRLVYGVAKSFNIEGEVELDIENMTISAKEKPNEGK